MTDLTDQAINVAVAEFCGWRMVEYPFAYPSKDMLVERLGQDVVDQLICYGYERIAQFAADLNAIAEAEKRLTDEQHRLYRSHLFTDAYNSGTANTNDEADRRRVSATARQRSVALLRVVKPELFA